MDFSPLDLERLAVRIEALQRVSTHGWRGDELVFRNRMPNGRSPRRLPEPRTLRDMARRLRGDHAQGTDAPDLREALTQVRTWLNWTMDQESVVRDNDPRNPKVMLRDMARGKLPRF